MVAQGLTKSRRIKDVDDYFFPLRPIYADGNAKFKRFLVGCIALKNSRNKSRTAAVGKKEKNV